MDLVTAYESRLAAVYWNFRCPLGWANGQRNFAQAALCGWLCRQTVHEQQSGPDSEAADCLFLTVWKGKRSI